MHFGEFLVHKHILSAHQVLKALQEQRRRRHFIPLLLVELGALPDYCALKFCTEADQNGEDFLEIIMREGIISQQQCTQIRTTWRRSGPPLGQMLVELGLINEATLIAALEEYEAYRKEKCLPLPSLHGQSTVELPPSTVEQEDQGNQAG